MSNLFSKGKFSKFISSKGFYVAVVVCLVGAGVATWLAVNRTINGIEHNNNQLIESENQWNEYPKLEEAERKVEGIKTPDSTKSSQSQSSSSTASSSSAPASAPVAKSDASQVSEKSPNLAYALPIKGEILSPFSNGELIKSITLNDWRTHDGVDIAADKGAEVMAAAAGTVTDIRSDPLWGTIVTIDHPDGNQTFYCGLDRTVMVKVGDAIDVKHVIGKVDGVPCEVKQKNHLHFAMQRDGQWVDPLGPLQKAVG